MSRHQHFGGRGARHGVRAASRTDERNFALAVNLGVRLSAGVGRNDRPAVRGQPLHADVNRVVADIGRVDLLGAANHNCDAFELSDLGCFAAGDRDLDGRTVHRQHAARARRPEADEHATHDREGRQVAIVQRGPPADVNIKETPDDGGMSAAVISRSQIDRQRGPVGEHEPHRAWPVALRITKDKRHAALVAHRVDHRDRSPGRGRLAVLVTLGLPLNMMSAFVRFDHRRRIHRHRPILRAAVGQHPPEARRERGDPPHRVVRAVGRAVLTQRRVLVVARRKERPRALRRSATRETKAGPAVERRDVELPAAREHLRQAPLERAAQDADVRV